MLLKAAQLVVPPQFRSLVPRILLGHTPHSDHPVHKAKRLATDPIVKAMATNAVLCGGKPAQIARSLVQLAAQNAAGQVQATSTMSTKQIHNLKHRTATSQMPVARTFEELMVFYDAEIREGISHPYRVPMIATWANSILSREDLQLYIDTTFGLVIQNRLITPLLFALPLVMANKPPSQSTIGPVLPLAFFVHANREAADYVFFLRALNTASGNRLSKAVWHRDFDGAIAKAIKEVCFISYLFLLFLLFISQHRYAHPQNNVGTRSTFSMQCGDG